MFMDVSLPLSKTTYPDTTPPATPAMNTGPLDGCGVNPVPLPPNEVSNAHVPSMTHNNPKNNVDDIESLDIPSPILTLAVFSSSEIGKSHKSIHGSKGKYPNKGGFSGDSDDEFLGMASVDLTSLLTGKRDNVDCWLPLSGGTGSVRIACEYETTDCPPKKGDFVRFTRFCHPADLYPLAPGRIYPVQEVIDKDHILLNYTSPEGWICSFMVHRFMVLCVERHHGAVEACREEWQSITERLSHSPLVGTVAQTVERLPEEGLVAVGANVIQGGASLLGRWLEGGFDTAIKDVAFATNWDGRFNPGLNATPTQSTEDDNTSSSQPEDSGNSDNQEPEAKEPPITLPEASPKSSSEKDALPGMPNCPITGEPMIDPVVAADGHSYERAAIARWLQTSDKSPLTGSILPHKELVPNYGLLSSLQEQAEAQRKTAPQAKKTQATNNPEPKVSEPEDAPSKPVGVDIGPTAATQPGGQQTEVAEDSTEAENGPVTVAFIDGSEDESSAENEPKATDGSS
jgi:U-box domain